MKALGDIVQAMKSPEDLQREQQRGLTTTGGSALTQRREVPLTQNQLTQIASNVLQGQPTITLSKRKIYGRKTLHDEYGSYEVDNEPVGEEEYLDVLLPVNTSSDGRWLEAALRIGQPKSILPHLLRLSIHKRLGSSDEDRAVLINDYAEALSVYPEFVVYLACRSIWENDESPFCPKIKMIKDLCEAITYKLKPAKKQEAKAITKKEEEWRPPTEEEKQAVSDMINNLTKVDKHD